jgi:hypothetical protein
LKETGKMDSNGCGGNKIDKSVQDKVQRAVKDMSREEVRFLRFLLDKAVDLMEEGREAEANPWLKCAATRVFRFLREHELIAPEA